MKAWIHKALRGAACLGAAGILAACGGGGGAVSGPAPGAPEVPDISNYPPVANDNAPGASAKAIAAHASLGRGVNFGNMLEAPTEGAWGVTVTDDFITKAKAAGFQSVRLPVRWSNHALGDAPYTIDPTFMARVETVVDKLLAEGFVVMLNMHHYRQLDGDTLDAGEASVDSRGVQVRFVMLWEQIAQRFANRGDKLILELYNEPHGNLDASTWNTLAARALGVVRKSNPDRVVVIGPTQWNSASSLAALKMPNDANLIATVHNYEPFSFTHQGAEWSVPIQPTGVTCCSNTQFNQMVAPLNIAKSWADNKRYPIFVGEFGAYSKADMASRVNFNRTMRDEMENRGMTWSYWEFASGFGVYDPTTLSFRQSLLDSLLQ